MLKKIPLLTAMIIILCCSGCDYAASKLESSVSSSSSSKATEGLEASTQSPYMCDDKGNITAVNLISKGILAYYHPTGILAQDRFDLPPTVEAFPEEVGTTTYYDDMTVSIDFAEYKERLNLVDYNIKLHTDLKPQLNELIARLLMFDDVIPRTYDYMLGLTTKWQNESVLEQFIQDHVTVTYFDDSDLVDESDRYWCVYEGGCFATSSKAESEGICSQHRFEVWLIDDSGDEIILWDIVQVEEAGCGRALPW